MTWSQHLGPPVDTSQEKKNLLFAGKSPAHKAGRRLKEQKRAFARSMECARVLVYIKMSITIQFMLLQWPPRNTLQYNNTAPLEPFPSQVRKLILSDNSFTRCSQVLCRSSSTQFYPLNFRRCTFVGFFA